MKKRFFFTLCGLALFSAIATAQPVVTDANVVQTAEGTILKRQFKVSNPAQDKTDQFEIISIGAVTFTASNTSDGTTNSYKHTQKTTLQLFPAGNKTGTYLLNFYTENQQIPEAANYADGTLNIYYPLSMLQTMKESLEKALSAKKKVFIKVTQKTNGYREGTLVF